MFHKQKAGASKLAPSSKIYADIFEVVAAEVYLYADFDGLRDWVAGVFRPLIEVAVQAFKT
jgi:dsRNA-specific ribonuclease